MDASEEHLFDQAEIDAEIREEREGEDMEGALVGPRSEDGSDSEGSLKDFVNDEELSEDNTYYAAVGQHSPPPTLPPHLRSTRRRIVLRFVSFVSHC